MALWMHTSDYEWLHSHIQSLRRRAVHEMEEGATMERYAELRGSIQAYDAVLQSPERYVAQMRAEHQAREDEDAA